MAIIHVTEATGGAPNSGRMSGTAGDLYAMLKYALPLNGWAIEYDDPGNFGLVARPGTGNRFRLFVLDNATASGAATLALVRGCENASAATTAGIVDPFPTVAKTANTSSNWQKSSTANTTARNFDIYVGTTWVIFLVNYASGTNVWDLHLYGDLSPAQSGDPYATLCAIRNTASAGSTSNIWACSSGTGVINYSLCRSFDGTVKSTTSGAVAPVGSFFGAMSSFPPALAGPSTGIERLKCTMMDVGAANTTVSATLGIPNRGYFPNLWMPQHGGRGTLNTRDTFTDTAYNPSATFKVFCLANSGPSGFIVIEETDTWSPP